MYHDLYVVIFERFEIVLKGGHDLVEVRADEYLDVRTRDDRAKIEDVHGGPEDVGALLDDEDLAARRDAPHRFKDVIAQPKADDNQILRLVELDRLDVLDRLGKRVPVGVHR